MDNHTVSANGQTFTVGAVPENLFNIVANGGLIADTRRRLAEGVQPSEPHELDYTARRKKGFTMAEKLLRKNAGVDEVKPGDIVITHPDMFMIHDIYTPYLLDTLKQIGADKIADPDKVTIIFDHCIPWAFPSIAIALVWKWMLNGIQGYIPTMLMKLGLSDGMLQFLSDPKLVLPTLVFINIWFGAPMIMVNVYAALQTVPQDQYEAALIDGASSWQSFIHITVPHIKVVVGLLVVLRTIWVFNNFDIIFMTTAGGPASMTTTMPLYIYDLGWTNKLVGRASAASIILLAFLIAVCLIYFAVITHWEKEDQA